MQYILKIRIPTMAKKRFNLIFKILIVFLFSVLSLMGCVGEHSENIEIEEEVEYLEETYDFEVETTPISVSSSIGKMVFGKFPQSLKGDVHISKTKSSNGYYLGNDGNYYVLSDGHYYLIEDIIWDAYELESGDILLVSEKILFSAKYDDYVDYFDREADVFERSNFVFTDIEKSLIQSVGLEYGENSLSYTRFYDTMFFLDVEKVQELYPTSNKIVKEPTTYALQNLEVNDDDYSSWWLAPKNSRDYYVSDEGTISSKRNTYLDTSELIARIKYAYRGIAPAIIISNN